MDDAVRQLMICSHVDAAMAALDDPVAFAELGTRIAAGDRLCQQLALYEYGGLWDFLDVKAQPGLIDRCDQIVAWSEQPMNGYVIEEARGPLLDVVDLRTGGEVEVLNIGALTGLDRGAPVIGRLGPISSDPGLMFQGTPISVDLTTAQGVAESSGPQDDWPLWVPAVADGAHDGRLPYAFSCGRPTLYCSDIVAMDDDRADVDTDTLEAPGRLLELRAAGLDDFVANGVMVAEVALIAVTVSGPDAVSAVGPHLASVIVEPRVLDALRVHCTAPEHEHHWDILAAGHGRAGAKPMHRARPLVSRGGVRQHGCVSAREDQVEPDRRLPDRRHHCGRARSVDVARSVSWSRSRGGPVRARVWPASRAPAWRGCTPGRGPGRSPRWWRHRRRTPRHGRRAGSARRTTGCGRSGRAAG